jgi:hypothetical protein
MAGRLSAPLVRQWMRRWRNEQADVHSVAQALGVSRRRAYQLRTSYLASCAAGNQKQWQPGSSGGDHQASWPEEVLALVHKLLSADPAANYALVASEIERRCAHKLHRASIRRYALEKGLAPSKPLIAKTRAGTRRWQRQSIGELWQLDSTPHPWFGSEEPSCHLLNMLDDCSRLNTGAQIYERETLLSYLDFLPRAFLQHKMPLELYVDYHSIFFTHDPESLTQLGQALRFYEVSFRYAPTPQAKGKIERHHQYWQGRLPTLFSEGLINEVAPANMLLEKLRSHHNAHEIHRELDSSAEVAWNTAIAHKRNVLRPVPKCSWWPYIWSVRTSTRVTEDQSITLGQQRLRINLPKGKRVVRCQHPDGTYTVLASGPDKSKHPEVILRLGPKIAYPWSN